MTYPETMPDPMSGPLDPWFGGSVDGLQEIVRVYDTHGESYMVRVQDVLERCPLHRSMLHLTPAETSTNSPESVQRMGGQS